MTTQEFYELGLQTRVKGKSLEEAIQTEEIWRRLKGASAKEQDYFVAGFFARDIPTDKQPVIISTPAPPVGAYEIIPVEPKPPVTELAEITPNDFMQALTRLIDLLEKNLSAAAPKIKETFSTVERDQDGNMTGQRTKYTYEDE